MHDETPKRLRDQLGRLVEASGGLLALLVSCEGMVLAEAGNTSILNATAAAALVAGMYSATKEVARMVGEQQFSILLQQGENRHVHISLVNERTMLVIVFEDYQRIGRVRHEARKTSVLIADTLVATPKGRAGAAEELTTADFREYALNLVDRIFATR